MKLGRVCLAGTLAATLLAVSGCGSDESNDDSRPLPRELGEDLARMSDRVQSTLEQGRGCAAKRQAGRLREDVERAIDEGRVSADLQPELRDRAVRLENSITCIPPPSPPQPPVRTDTGDDGDEDE